MVALHFKHRVVGTGVVDNNNLVWCALLARKAVQACLNAPRGVVGHDDDADIEHGKLLLVQRIAKSPGVKDHRPLAVAVNKFSWLNITS